MHDGCLQFPAGKKLKASYPAEDQKETPPLINPLSGKNGKGIKRLQLF